MATSPIPDAGRTSSGGVASFLARALLFAIAALVIYLWMARASSDLTWDEAMNFRVYARNPVTAIALYNEYNNHPFESLIKSVFYSVLGLDAPSVLRITGFLFVAAWVAIGWSLYRTATRNGDLIGGTLLALLMLLTRGFSYQAMELRGYFLSILLEFLWFWVLVRETGLLERTARRDRAPWTGWTAARYALMAALIVFTLPSNVLAIPPLALLTVAAFREPGVRLGASDLRRFLGLGVLSALLSLVLYLPIFLGIWLGFSTFHNQVARHVTDALAAMRDEIGLVVTQLAPRGMSESVFGWALLAVLAVAALFAFRPGRRIARIGFLVLGCALLLRLVFAAFVVYQTRVRCALVPPLAIGLFLVVHDTAGRWSARWQAAGAIVLVLASFALVPVLIEESTPYRVPSDVSSFLEVYCRPETRNVLIVNDRLEDPLVTVGRVFGPDHVVASLSDLDSRFKGEAPPPRLKPGTWKRWLRDLVLPEDPFHPIDAAKVDVLVVIDDESKGNTASQWRHPALEGIKARLTKVSEFRRAEYRILVFERAGS